MSEPDWRRSVPRHCTARTSVKKCSYVLWDPPIEITDVPTDELFVSELNPRLLAIRQMSNHSGHEDIFSPFPRNIRWGSVHNGILARTETSVLPP